jgi:integrase
MTQAIHDLFEFCIEGKASEDYLFTRPNGKRVRDFRDAWDKARIAAGVPELLFHDLRAERILQQFLERVHKVNATSDYLY